MPYTINIQPTPNPNALKFILNERVINRGNVTFKNAEEAQNTPLVQALFALPNVTEVFLNENYVTVTQSGQAAWDEMENSIQTLILENMPVHNPDIQLPASTQDDNSDISADPQRQKIEELLNQNIRPYLQMDGGDVQVVDFKNNVLSISYKGACGGCPGATMGTLRAIENVLRDKYDSNIVVQMAS